MKPIRLLLLISATILTVSQCYSQQIVFEGLSEVKPLKRGNTYQFNWSGGGSDSKMKIEMLRRGEVIDTWETDNQGLASITLSKKIKPADDYSFKISAPGSGEVVQTRTYKIRRKFPLGLQVLSVAAIPVVYFLFKPKDEPLGEPLLGPPPSPKG